MQALRYEKDPLDSSLCELLIQRASKHFDIANKLYWYLTVEACEPKIGMTFANILDKYNMQLQEINPTFFQLLERQQLFVDKVTSIARYLKSDKDTRPNKIVKLKKMLATKGEPWHLEKVFPEEEKEPLMLPLNPKIKVVSFYPDAAHVFKSAMQPLGIPFLKEGFDENDKKKSTYKLIFKCGDDLRQDQLIIQLIALMDKLLKKNGLDLKLTPYCVLATSRDTGFVEVVDNVSPLAEFQSKTDIRGWIKEQNANNDEAIKMAHQNFIKSCGMCYYFSSSNICLAGYCVITYILGVGDRHLDNILLTPAGTMFHIDFGFILGRDPKPLPPPMKLCKEMVEGMGGAKSEGYTKFIELCCTAFNILRKSADLILNMFVLMSDAKIKDVDHNAADSLNNIMKVQDKFKLELTDAEASKFMQSIISESEKALFPQITETIHRWAQYWRK